MAKHNYHSKRLYQCTIDEEDPDSYATGRLFSVELGQLFKDGRYRVLHKLGHGGFATIWLARDQLNNENVAMKFVNTTINSREHRILCHLRSSSIARQYSAHPGRDAVVQLLDDFELNDSHSCLVLVALGDDLQARIDTESCRRLPKATALSIMYRVTLGLDYLWKCGIAHGDLYTRNILSAVPAAATQSEARIMSCLGPPHRGSVGKLDGTSRDSRVPSYLVRSAAFRGDATRVKIADLGNAFFHDEPPLSLSAAWHVQAPELIFAQSISKSIDLWSLGCLFFEVITGRTLVDSIMADKVSVIDGLASILGRPPNTLLNGLDFETRRAVGLRGTADMPFDQFFTLNYNHDDTQLLEDEEWEIPVEQYEKPLPEFSDYELQLLGSMIAKLLSYEPHSRATIDEVIIVLSKIQAGATQKALAS